jgi:hypothetical protein
MKFLLTVLFIATSFNLFAASTYECEFLGPNYFLTIDDNEVITLKNNFKSYNCEKGFVNFPGTELELRVLNCANRNEKVTYYFAEMNDDIILSKSLGTSKDITCKKK